MSKSLNVLIVEDSEQDAALLVRELQRGGYRLSYERVDSEQAMTSAMNERRWDIVLSDYSMPQFNAKAALAVITKSQVDTPCIIVSGAVGEETAIEVMLAGAQDLVLKNNLKRLLPAIARELEAARTRSAKKVADAKLDCERQLLHQLMRGIPDGICFKDRERRYIRLNDAERVVLNIQSDGEAIGKTIDEFVPSELAHKRRAEEERVLATGEALVDCIEKVTCPNGDIRWVSATKAPIRSSTDEIVGIVEISRDITERKRQERLKDEFIATVSHELRTPLTSILGSIGCLVGGTTGGLPAPVMRMLNIAMGNCRRLVGIVNDILDMEKVEAGKMLYDRKPVEIRGLIDQTIESNQSFATSFGVSLRLEGTSTDGVVNVDPDRLAQALTNLVSNAIKFSPRDAEVTVSIENRLQTICIGVRDHGPGIPEDYKDRIFEKFVQVDATDRREKGGTGLGLPITKHIVEQLGGTIGFEPAAGGGTIFKITLPALNETNQAAADHLSSTTRRTMDQVRASA